MNCQETEPFLEGFFDGELDLVRNLDIEKHVEGCEGCAKRLKNQQALRTTLKSAGLSYRAPDSLRQWAVSQTSRSDEHSSSPPSPLSEGRGSKGEGHAFLHWRAWIPSGAMALALATLYVGTIAVSQATSERRLAQDVVSAHVRSLMASHLTDVTSTNQHTVKPWFNGKVDFAPVVRDLSDYSFPLIGGRLDYLADRPVAALVYQRQQHFINLFLWPTPKESDHSLHPVTRRGYNLFTWTKSGMTYWAISDLNSKELQEFAQIIQTQALLP